MVLPAQGSSHSCSSTLVCLAGCAHCYSEEPDMLTWFFLLIRTHLMANGTDVSFAIPRATDVCFITNTLKSSWDLWRHKNTSHLSKIGNHCSSLSNIDAISTAVSQGSLNSHPVCWRHLWRSSSRRTDGKINQNFPRTLVLIFYFDLRTFDWTWIISNVQKNYFLRLTAYRFSGHWYRKWGKDKSLCGGKGIW